MRAASLNFATLQRRLLGHIRSLLRNGEMTERRLARQIGMSQPHVHNVLKGVRLLTADMADLFLEGLGTSVLDLASPDELGESLERLRLPDPGATVVPLLKGVLGPRSPFPDATDPEDWLRLPAEAVSGLRRPALARVDADPELPRFIPPRGMALLNFDEGERLAPHPRGWYALRWSGAGYLRQVRREGDSLAVLGQRAWSAPPGPDAISLHRVTLPSVIRARVAWVGRDLRQRSPFDQAGVFLDIPAST